MPRVSNDELSSYLDGVRERDLPMLPREASVAWDLLDARRELATMTAKAELHERALRVAANSLRKINKCHNEKCIKVKTEEECQECWFKLLLNLAKQAEQAENVAEVGEK